MQQLHDDIEDIDMLLHILRRVSAAAPAVPKEAMDQVEREIRAEFGGRRFKVLKRGKRPTAEQRRAIFAHAMTDAPDAEIAQQHGISRSTLYRLIKKGG